MAEQIDMGIGPLGFRNQVFKRKFRYTFELEEICNGANANTATVPPYFVKLASRPNISVEETEINYLNAKSWIPGKASWETITVTYIDVATADAEPLYHWLATVSGFSDPVTMHQGSRRKDYSAVAVIKLWDGCGQIMEKWELADVWPTGINFGDLDYSSSEEVTIELTLRYSQVKYESLCPPFKPASCCSPCDGNAGQPAGEESYGYQGTGFEA